jgi:hypothetical protein
MSKFVKNFHLPDRTLAPLNVHEFVAIVDFDGDFLSSLPVQGVLDDSISSVADGLANLVVVDVGAVGGGELGELGSGDGLGAVDLGGGVEVVLEGLPVFLRVRALTLSLRVKLFSWRTVMRFLRSTGAAVCTRSLLASA